MRARVKTLILSERREKTTHNKTKHATGGVAHTAALQTCPPTKIISRLLPWQRTSGNIRSGLDAASNPDPYELDESAQSSHVSGIEEEADYNQHQSTFFSRLPLEIRRFIYKEIFNTKVHILTFSGPEPLLTHEVCEAEGTASQLCKYCENPTNRKITPCLKAPQHGESLIGCLHSCRRFYDEAFAQLYESTTFSFAEVATFRRFRIWDPAGKFPCLRSLELSFYPKILLGGRVEAVSMYEWSGMLDISSKELTQLQHLSISLGVQGMYWIDERVERWLLDEAAVIRLSRGKKWIMMLHWGKIDQDREPRELPFVIHRRLYDHWGIWGIGVQPY